MPKTDVIFYRDDDGAVPAREFIYHRRLVPPKAAMKLLVLIERLEEKGHELQRPAAALLRDGIYELRARHLNVNYRLLYAFYNRAATAAGEQPLVAVVLLGLTKEDVVPTRDIDTAIRFMNRFRADPAAHSDTHGDEPEADERRQE